MMQIHQIIVKQHMNLNTCTNKGKTKWKLDMSQRGESFLSKCCTYLFSITFFQLDFGLMIRKWYLHKNSNTLQHGCFFAKTSCVCNVLYSVRNYNHEIRTNNRLLNMLPWKKTTKSHKIKCDFKDIAFENVLYI